MRILVLTGEFPPVGGGGHVAKDLCQGLSELGHEIKILSAGILSGIHGGTGSSEKAYEIIRVPTPRRDPSRASILAMVSYIINSVFRGFFLCKRWKPEVIHVHFAVPAGPTAWVLSKLTGIPYVLTVHLGDILGRTPDKTDRWFRFIQPFTFPIWKHAKQVIAVSQFTRRLAQNQYQVPIKVIHNGVDIWKFKPERMAVHNPPRIIFAGRFVLQKNPILVIQTLAELDEYVWELVMLGDGPLFKETKEEAKKHGLEDRVKFSGWVHPDDVKKEFQQSDILFLPSKSEGLPVVGVQALTSGLALIVSDI
jgi:glycosyltransferase involved in cell wall biosynthesis